MLKIIFGIQYTGITLIFVAFDITYDKYSNILRYLINFVISHIILHNISDCLKHDC